MLLEYIYLSTQPSAWHSLTDPARYVLQSVLPLILINIHLYHDTTHYFSSAKPKWMVKIGFSGNDEYIYIKVPLGANPFTQINDS